MAGGIVMWCGSCKAFIRFDKPEDFGRVCPRCGMGMSIFKCTRCGHTWMPRNGTGMPKNCPNKSCKSPYWNKERTRMDFVERYKG